MSHQLIDVQRSDDGVARIVLDDPDRRNALSYAMGAELLAAFSELDEDAAVRCIVFASSHPTTFSAGGDLSAMSGAASPIEQFESTAQFRDLLQSVAQSRTPVVCAAAGRVFAGALGLALACDLVIAREDATFATPEINVGIFPFMVAALMYRNVGRKAGNELMLLGRPIAAEEARRIGIVNHVVPTEAFDEAVDDVAQTLAAKSPLLMRMGKEALAQQMDLPLGASLDYLHHRLVLGLTTDDIREGVAAFFGKREPVWSGR